MTQRSKNLLLEYLSGELSVDEVRTQLGRGHPKMAKRIIGLVELDQHCRQILSQFEPPTGAADRLAKTVYDIEPYVNSENTLDPQSPSKVASNSLIFDVFGAQYTRKKHKNKPDRIGRNTNRGKRASNRDKSGR